MKKATSKSFYKFFLVCLFIFQANAQTHAHENRVIGFYEERDLELFDSPNKSHTGVWKKFDHTQTILGKKSLQDFFKNPTSTIKTLKNRQNIIKKLLTNTNVKTSLSTVLQTFSNHEFAFSDALDLEKNAVAQTVISSFYFQYAWLQKFNSSPLALDLKNVFKTLGLFSPVLEHIILHFALDHIQNALGNNNHDTCDHEDHHDHHEHHEHHHGHGHNHVCIDHIEPAQGSSTFVRGLFLAIKACHFAMHIVSIKEMLEHVQQQIAVVNELYKQLVATKICLESMEAIDTILKKDPELLQAFGTNNPIATLFSQLSESSTTTNTNTIKESKELKELINLLSDDYFDNTDDLSYFSSLGKTLRAHKLLHETMPELQPALTMVGEVDAYLSVTKKFQQANSPNPDKQTNAPFCFVNFLDTDKIDTNKPVITMKKVWNIMLEPDDVVTNDITLGDNLYDTKSPSKIIITGPNKTGKSSFIKALALNIIFAQTFGIAAAESADMTIFHKVLSYITVTDDISNDTSMLVAEILRADQCLKDLKNLKPNEFAFVVIDDSLFKGTTFEKGQEAAYQFVKEIGTFNNSIACIATHLPLLTKLETNFQQFANYRIKIGSNPSGGAFSTFILERGVSSPDDVFKVIQEQGYTSSWL